MNDFLKSIGRGFAGLLRFGGRDSRARFWPYAAFVFAAAQIAAMASLMPIFARVFRYALENPGQTRVDSGPGYYSIEILGNAPELAPVFEDAMNLGAILTAFTLLLLAAAVARRLHDRDLRGYWGLLPLPCLVAGLVLMPRAAAGISSAGEPDPGWLAGLFANNLAYLGALGWLVYLLAGAGTPGPNRFGPPPV